VAHDKTMAVVPSWVEAHCVIPDGFRKGDQFRLYDFQLEYFARFYLVRGDVEYDAVNPILAPAFVFRRGMLVGPQKLGKGPHTAAHICAEGVGPVLFFGWAGRDDGFACSDWGCGCGWEHPYDPGEPMGMPWPTPLIQITAFSEEQTDNIYDALRPMIREGPLADVIPKTGEEFIRLPGGGRIDTVTSSAQSRLGQRVTFVPQDEVGIWTKSNKMDKVADTQYRGLAGMGGRASLTTNAWDPSEQSVAQVQYESLAKDVYCQFVQPPSRLSYTNKRERAQIHRAVYPPDVRRENGGHVDLDAIENEAVDLMVRDTPQAKRFFGNILTVGYGAAVEPDRWQELYAPRTVLPGTPIGVGFDGSISDDATVMRACTQDGYSWTIHAQVRPQGVKDWRVNRQAVHEALAETFERYTVGRVFADPPKWWSELEQWAEIYGEEIVLAFDTNQDRRMAPAVDRWLTAIALGTHTHDGDPVVTSHVLAAQKKKARAKDPEDDMRTLYVLSKPGDGRKIDGAVADVLALQAAETMEIEAEVDVQVMFV
jgi:hypothetical protein